MPRVDAPSALAERREAEHRWHRVAEGIQASEPDVECFLRFNTGKGPKREQQCESGGPEGGHLDARDVRRRMRYGALYVRHGRYESSHPCPESYENTMSARRARW